MSFRLALIASLEAALLTSFEGIAGDMRDIIDEDGAQTLLDNLWQLDEHGTSLFERQHSDTERQSELQRIERERCLQLARNFRTKFDGAAETHVSHRK